MVTKQRSDNPNRDMAMKNAYNAAKARNAHMAQYWYNRACQFATPTERQVAYLRRVAVKAGIKLGD